MTWIIIMAFVCNLNFGESQTLVTPASSAGAADGTILVFALDPDGGTIKYNLNSDFTYASGGQTSSIFSNLVPGSYSVYARSSATCRKILVVTVGYILTYTPLYRLGFSDQLSGTQFLYRFDIEDREFTGAVTEVKGNEDPIRLSWRAEGVEDPFYPVLASECSVTLKSLTDAQFDILSSQDERRYRGSLYLWNGSSYVLKWRGFLVHMNSEEPYNIEVHYDVILTFTDGLADLALIAFSDDSENIPVSRLSFMQAILFCLHKTNIELDVWETVNFLTTSMDSLDDDSTLEQTYFDPAIFLLDDGTMMDSLTVLARLMETLGSRIIQSEGHWQIDDVSKKASSSNLVRKRTITGDSLGSSTESPRLMLRTATAVSPRLTFKNQSGFKKNTTQYGKIIFTHDLGIEKVNNILTDGSFQDEDIANGQLKGWQLDKTDGPFTTASIEEVDILKIVFNSGAGITTQEVVLLSSLQVSVVNTALYRLHISFEVNTSPNANTQTAPTFASAYIFVDYSISITDVTAPNAGVHYVQPVVTNGTQRVHTNTTDLLSGKYLRTYITEHSTWKTISLDVLVDDILVDGQFQISFRFSNNPIYDHASLAALKAEDTSSAAAYSTRTYNNRRRVLDTTPGFDAIRFYELEAGSDAESSPDILRPNVFSTYVWKLKETTSSPNISPLFIESWLSNILVRNVKVGYFPANADPVETVLSEIILNTNFKNKLEKTFVLGDVPTDQNYKNISHGWLSLADGTPTSLWNYRGVDPVAPRFSLTDFVRKMYQGQSLIARWKLSGEVDCLGALPFPARTIYEVRTGRIYLLMSPQLLLRSRGAMIEMVETLKGTPAPDVGVSPDPDIEPPVDLGEFTSEFTFEFNRVL